MTLHTLATLQKEQVLMPYQGGKYSLVEKNYLTALIERALSQVPVDENFYRGRYPDILPALKRREIKTSKEHYIKFGFFEHRFPYPIKVDEKWYLENYPDVRSAVASKDFSNGQYHFDEFGFREGRLPFKGFSLESGGT